MEKYIFIAAVILGLIEIALYQIKDKKKRFVAMAYVGVFVMALIFVGMKKQYTRLKRKAHISRGTGISNE